MTSNVNGYRTGFGAITAHGDVRWELGMDRYAVGTLSWTDKHPGLVSRRRGLRDGGSP